MAMRPTSEIDRVVTSLAGAVLAAYDRPTLEMLRRLVLEGKPLAELVDDDLGTDLLCLVNLKLDQPPPLKQIEYYAGQVKKDIQRSRQAESTQSRS